MRKKLLVASTTTITLVSIFLYLIGIWLPVESLPLWLSSGFIFGTLIVLWLYSLVNTFNLLWLEKSDMLLELIHGFSIIGVLWFLASSFGVMSIQQLGYLDLQIQQAIAMIVIYLTTVRTMLNVLINPVTNIARWITLISISLAMGMTLVYFFVNDDAGNSFFSKLYISTYILAFAGFLITILFHLSQRLPCKACMEVEKNV